MIHLPPNLNGSTRNSGVHNNAGPVSNDPSNKVTSTTPNALSPHQTAINPQTTTTALSLLEKLHQGQQLTAQVKTVQTLNSNDKSLLKQVNPSLIGQLQTGLTKTLTEQLVSIKTNRINTITPQKTNGVLIDKARLHLVKLAIAGNIAKGNAKSLLLTAITPHHLKANEQVLISGNKQQLVIHKLETDSLQPAIMSLTKHILPKQQPVSQLQQFTGQLVSVLQQLPKPIQQQLVSLPVFNNAKALQAFTHTNESLSQASQVKQALQHSGVGLESKIRQGLPLTPDFRTAIDKLMTTINASDSKATNIKAQALDTLLANIFGQSATPSLSGQSILSKILPQNTSTLFQLLGIPLPIETLKNTALPKLIEQHLKKVIEQTQAKIQFNQLRSLGLDAALNDGKLTLSQQFHTELPLRFNEQVFPVQINIHEQEQHSHKENTDENNDNKEESQSTKKRCWQVFMSFDLPNNERLHSQLNIIDDTVSATLWAESSGLCQKAQQEIALLRDKFLASGLTVDDLNCLQGKPPQKHELSYHLIDVKT